MTPDAAIAAYPEMTLRDYVRIIFRQKAVILASVMTVLLTVAVGLKLKTPVYDAQVKLLVSSQKQVESIYYRDIPGDHNAEVALTQSEIVKSNPVLERTVDAMKLHERPLDYERRFASSWKAPFIDRQVRRAKEALSRRSLGERDAIRRASAIDSLRGRIMAEPVRGTNLFVITVEDFDPVQAAAIANTASRSYVIFDVEQQLAEMQLKYGDKHQAIQQLQDTIKGMAKSLNEGALPNLEAIGPASVKIVEQATIPLKRAGPSELMIALFAGVMSLILGFLLAFIAEYLDQTVKSPSDIHRHLQMPYVASIPRRSLWTRRVIRDPIANNAYAEANRSLADQIYVQSRDRKANSLLVTAPVPLEGATTTIANLGICLASRIGQNILLIDANLRHPTLHQCFQKPQSAGLAESLEGRESWEPLLVQVAPHLWILPAGSTNLNPLTLFESPRMAWILEQAKTRFGMVLVDCADARRYTDGAMLARLVDGVVLVIADGKTRRQVLQAALEPLAHHLQVKLLGVVLNARRYAIPKVIYDLV